MPMRTSSNPALYTFDAAKRAEHGNICGVDEAGRGPLCGPVCVAAVILNPDDPIEGVNDSKKLSEKRREALFDEIIARALCYQIVFISPQEIDERNILWATMDGMEQAVAGLAVTPDYVLVDGNRCPPNLAQPAEAVVKGDANSASIAAASTLAVCLPSFAVIYLISLFFDRFLQLTVVANAFKGIQACVIYLILSAGVKMLKNLQRTPFNTAMVAVVLAAMVGFSVLAVKFSSICCILLCGAAGVLAYAVGQGKKGGTK